MANTTQQPKKRGPKFLLIATFILLLASNIILLFLYKRKPAANNRSITWSELTVTNQKNVSLEALKKTKLGYSKSDIDSEISVLRSMRRRLVDSLRAISSDTIPSVDTAEIYKKNMKIKDIDAELNIDFILSVCQKSVDPVDIVNFKPTTAASGAFLKPHIRTAGLLSWLPNLANLMRPLRGTAGHVAGLPVGSGCLIASDLFLTAGHCFSFEPGDTINPRVDGLLISPELAATFMRVYFNYELNGQGSLRKDTISYPVIRLIEFKVGTVDYALLRLGKDRMNALAGATFGIEKLCFNRPETEEEVAIIQHPNLGPIPFTRKINIGNEVCEDHVAVHYSNLSTTPCSSGAPIISLTHGLIGIHIRGNCETDIGEGNQGVSIKAIFDRSDSLKKLIFCQ